MENNNALEESTDFTTTSLSSGANWLRWEPHVHGPGTVLNNQFKGSDIFEKYLVALENNTPTLRAIGITDYYSTDVYEAVIQAKKEGRLNSCELIFPNIEMRLDTGTVSGAWVNIHLLVSPEDPNHLEELRRFLSRISFDAHDDSFHCTKDDIIRLGKKTDSSITEDRQAQEIGSIQFKVSKRQLVDEYSRSAWAKANILIAVAGGDDGSGGVRDAADTTLRQEIEKFADIIFASSPAQRDFWLGKKSLTPDQIEARYGALKPCMHGSDAHTHATVGIPTLNRYTWIKGSPQFDSLRQACIEPEGRAFVGEFPPLGASTSQVIQHVSINGINWCETPKIDLNAGLVAIIGARGSGKTALAEIIAAGCDAIPSESFTDMRDKSFLNRARPELIGATVSINWGSGRQNEDRSLYSQNDASDKYPMARYLSQQFVDNLCSSDGLTDKLLKEVERIIFNAHDVNEREGNIDFAGLLELKASRPRATREAEETSLQELCDSIGLELEKIKLIDETKAKIAIKEATIKQYNDDRSKLVIRGSEARILRLGELTTAADKVRGYVRFYSQREQSLLNIQGDVKNFRVNKAPEELRGLKQKHTQSGLKDNDWSPFVVDFKGDVDKLVTEHLTKAQQDAKDWKGIVPSVLPPNSIHIPDNADLSRQTLALLEAEIARITVLVSADTNTTQRFTAITGKITQEQTACNILKENLTNYEAGIERVKMLREQRDECYGRVFEAVLQEETILKDLYFPIMTKLSGASGTLQKMAFSIKRTVNLDKWAADGEQLFDLREKSNFKGKGTLKQQAEEVLLSAWEKGSAHDVLVAMQKFQNENASELLKMSKVPRADKANFRTWAMQFAKWLYSTNHIQIVYGIDYDGVDLRKLSPGTRGIVLLLLYLGLDNEDDRPLIIDQPEENLDPKSIYDELVGLFIEAKQKRQVIMVTHNANLVVNTDADQIIIASTGERLPSGMPVITYMSGGLDEAHIRKEVCGILEGGEKAFIKRAHRLRVPLR
ncbi:TrlF family AAA-like ATPase [Pedobacter mucosus]|uniref:TrlF family AAA-like ATPase n=1 Tax=Pedobacter mucosus TaxID=2895286 RepID=UPI001EE4748D|nr:AAA family ATPase [Pedobacter mucosus]UKT64300.1 AAA family ATPase [Pedobacter mucosus]